MALLSGKEYLSAEFITVAKTRNLNGNNNLRGANFREIAPIYPIELF
jgi:hypothetical protein